MATGYGNFVSGSGYGWRVQVVVNVASETATTITYNVYGQFYNEHRILSFANGSVSGGGQSRSWDGSTRNLNSGNPGTTNFASYSVTLNKGSSARTETFSARFQVTGGYGNGTSNASVGVTVPAITYSAPNAPSNCSASRNSDTQATVTWSNGSTSTTQPRTAVLVERQTDSGSWVQVASLSASATNYSDNGISADHRYAYRVRSQGNGGTSGYSTSGYIYTTPAAPTSVTAAKESTSSVTLSAEGLPAWAEGYEIERTADGGGSWDSVGTAGTFPWTDASAPAGTIRYRVRSYRGDLYSAYVESNSITTITPPLAPTVQALPSVVATGSALTVQWTPNHPDGSEQSSAQIEYTVGSGSAQTATVQGSATSYRLPASATSSAGTVSVRVRTHGLDDEWGAWSAAQTVRVAVPPSVAITSPATDGSIVDALPVTFAWTASDSTGVSSQTFELIYGGRTVLTRQLSGSVRSLELTDSDYLFANLTGYSVRLTVRGGSSLSTAAVRTFQTDWEEPAVPNAYVEYVDGLSCAVTVIPGDDEGGELPPPVSFSVVRLLPDGSQWLVADNLVDGQQALDRLPPLNVDYTYLVTAYAKTGVSSTQELPAHVDSGGMEAFNFGRGASIALLMGYNATGSESANHGGTLYDFATGDGSLPLFYPTGALTGSASRSYAVTSREHANRVRALSREYPEAWFRDFDGNRMLCKASFSISLVQGSKEVRTIDVTMDECAFEEATNG